MSQRLTMQSILSSRIVARLNVCSDDSRLYDWLNDFQERAWSEGRWWGSTQLMQFCLDDEDCLVLPREVAVIEAANLNGAHLGTANQWFQFVRPHTVCDASYNGCSTGSTCSCCGCSSDMRVQQRGTVASFATTTGTDKKLRVYPGNAADVGKKIIFQGKDSNGNWVRTSINGVQADGEQVTLAMPFVETSTTWGEGAPYAVIKEVTSYRVLVYSVDPDDNVAQLADYQPSETHPSYQRIQVPSTCCAANGCTTRTLMAVASLQHVPVTTANDWLLFQNLQAYSDGMMAAKLREEGNFALADAYFFGSVRPSKNARGPLRHSDGMGALPLLRAELRRMTGDVASANVQFTNTNLANFI